MLRDLRTIAANSSHSCQLLAAQHIISSHCVSTLPAALLVPPTMLIAVIYSVRQLPCSGHYVMADNSDGQTYVNSISCCSSSSRMNHAGLVLHLCRRLIAIFLCTCGTIILPSSLLLEKKNFQGIVPPI